MAKPSGAACNLDCKYCFYLEKAALFPEKRFRMDEEVLEAHTRNYLASHPAGTPVIFAWQGGEPTLMGLDFFRKAVALQKRHGAGREIQNTFQTNGTRLDDDWCRFLAENHFLVGLSMDGPAWIHDRYRVTRGGEPTHDRVLKTLKRLQRHKVEYNILACVNRLSACHPLEVYRFLRENGVEFIQFISIVERVPDARYRELGLTLNGPVFPRLDPAATPDETAVTDWSVERETFGSFMSAIFDEWVTRDVGRMFVMNFEWTLANVMGHPGASCHHQPICGRAVALEHNGDVYSCDHFVYPEYLLGNVKTASYSHMLDSPRQNAFGRGKFETLPKQCRACPVLKLCWGGCPKHRFDKTADGEPGLNYLCLSYFAFFKHALHALSRLADILRSGLPAETIMER